MERRSSYCACIFLRAAVLFFASPISLRSTMGSKVSVSSLLLQLLFLVEVHSKQTFPYVSFGQMSQALADHSYVDLSTVGSAGDNSVSH